MAVEKVTTGAEVRANLQTFNRDASEHIDSIGRSLKRTNYWIADHAGTQFGPAKFVGYVNMTFPVFIKEGVHGTNMHTDWKAIQNALTPAEFKPSPECHEKLRSWSTRTFGKDVLSQNDEKWQFIVCDHIGGEPGHQTGEDVNGLSRGLSDRQGYVRDAEVRRVIELRAMEVATLHLTNMGYECRDTSANKPFDLECTRNGEVLRVEVKGSTGDPSRVQLTKNEVHNARTHRTMLIVVGGIEVDVQSTTPEATNGTIIRIIDDWLPQDADLTAETFTYRIPPE